MQAFTTDKGWEKVLLDFISADMKTFKAIEILNPFNLKKHYNDKETIVDMIWKKLEIIL